MKIRRADPNEDEDTLRSLHDATFAESAPMPDWHEGTWWIAWEGDEPIAFIGFIPSTVYPDMAYFSRVGVMPIHRGKRLQQKLMRVMERKVKRDGYTGMVSDTTDNPSSANNFPPMGWRMFEPKAPWAMASTIYWRKLFTPRVVL